MEVAGTKGVFVQKWNNALVVLVETMLCAVPSLFVL